MSEKKEEIDSEKERKKTKERDRSMGMGKKKKKLMDKKPSHILEPFSCRCKHNAQ